MNLIACVHKLLGIAPIYKAAMRVLGDAQQIRKIQVQEYIRPERGGRILDIGCGPADIIENLPDDVEYVGVDFDASYINYARSRYGSRASFLCKSVFELSLDEFKDFDIVLAHGLLHHLNDAEVTHLLTAAERFLRPGGRMITYDGCFLESGQHPFDTWMLKNDRGKFVRTKAEYIRLAQPVFPSIRASLRSDLLRIPYTLLIMELSGSNISMGESRFQHESHLVLS